MRFDLRLYNKSSQILKNQGRLYDIYQETTHLVL